MLLTLIAGFVAISIGTPNALEPDDRMLFSFDEDDAGRSWRTVNDGVMGGRSSGRFRVTDGKLLFSGVLSLANNGGFASVRSYSVSPKLRQGDTLQFRVRGDGRKYSFNLYTPDRRTAFSYRADFKTKRNEWIEVSIPLDRFQATSFGRPVSNRPLRADQVSGIGILLGDKSPGEFKIEVDWIKAIRAEDE